MTSIMAPLKSNDSISTIASAFGVSTRVVASANNLRNPDRIYPGQRLHIPGPLTGGFSGSATVAYVVRIGDSLSTIAQRFGLKVRVLRSLNGLRGDLIFPGQRLALKPTLQRNPPLRSHSSASGGTYTVKRGETLWGIAAKLNIGLTDLKSWNDLASDMIFPGQKLALGASMSEFYTVMRGDTLYGVARRFGLPATDLARRNNISLNSTLLAGMKLEVGPNKVVD